MIFWVAALCGLVIAVRWGRAERRLGSTASRPEALVRARHRSVSIVAVMVDPIAGVAGYVAAHAIEYFAVVHSSLRKRSDEAPVAAVTRDTSRAEQPCTRRTSSPSAAVVYFTRSSLDGRLYAFAVLFFGALHILYDGFVWKLRRPAVAASLGITSST